MYPSKQAAATHTHLSDQLKKDDKQSTNSGTEDSGFFSGQNLTESFQGSYEETPRSVAQVGSSFLPPPSTLNKEGDSGVCSDIGQSRSINMNELCSKMGTLDVTRNEQQPPCDDGIGNTIYHIFVEQGNPDAMYQVIRLTGGVGLDTQNDFGRTALHDAVDTNQPAMVQCLIKSGANPAVRDIEGNTPLHIACANGATECAKEILYNRLYFSSQPAQDIDQWNYNGKRCVHLAVESSSVDILRYLINAGANINSREGKAGFTSLHVAVETSNYKMVDFLLKECPMLNIEQETYAGLTAYQLAGLLCDEHLLEVLSKRGAEQLSPPLSDTEEDDDDSDDQIPSFYGSNAFGSSFTGLPTINVA